MSLEIAKMMLQRKRDKYLAIGRANVVLMPS
jgi:hypothetical protein